MEDRVIEAFFDWYSLSIDVLLLLATIFFFKLPKEKRKDSYYWLPYLILAFTVFYETVGAYSYYDYSFNKWVNESIGNSKYPQYNLWLYNLANKNIGSILYLFLIKTWLSHSKKKYINWMIILFIFMSVSLQVLGIEPIYLNQPIIFAMGANMILIGSGLYFIDLMTSKDYLDANPLRLISFWQMTFLLFTFSLTYINSISLEYLWRTNQSLMKSLLQIDRVMSLLNLSILFLAIASPMMKKVFEPEPYHGRVR